MRLQIALVLVVLVSGLIMVNSCTQSNHATESRLAQIRENEWQATFDTIRSIEVSDQKRAIDLCYELLGKVQERQSNKWIIKLKIQEGRLHFYAGLMEKSTDCYLEAIELLKAESEVGLNHLDAHIGLGAILHAIGNHEAALVQFLEALIKLDSKADYYVKTYSSILANLGSTYISLEQYSKADSVMHVGIDFLLARDPVHVNLKTIYNNMAKLKSLLGEYEQALLYVGKVQAWERKNSGVYSLALSYLFQAEVYLKMKDTLQAKNTFFQAVHLADSLDLPVVLAGAARGLSALYQINGKSDSALFYASVNETALSESNAAMAAQKISAQAVKQYYEQQLEKLENKKGKLEIFSILVVVGVLITLGLLGFFLFRLRVSLMTLREKKTEANLLHESLEEQKAELSLKLDELNKLDQEQQQLEQSSQVIFQDLLKKLTDESLHLESSERVLIQKAMSKEDLKTWEKQFREFEQSFLAEEPEFMARLSDRFPGLTINERRLCVFYRQGLTNAEVAVLTKKSKPTILTAKSRLRSTLGIAKQDISLEDFIKTL